MLNVLITGAASGIGKACAEYFINNNHFVYALDINEINIDNVKSFKCDITSSDDLENVVKYFTSYDKICQS